MLGLGAVLLGLTFGRRWGWLSYRTIAPLVFGVAFVVAFFLRERRSSRPMIQGSLLRQRVFVSAVLASFFGFAANRGMTCGIVLLDGVAFE